MQQYPMKRNEEFEKDLGDSANLPSFENIDVVRSRAHIDVYERNSQKD